MAAEKRDVMDDRNSSFDVNPEFENHKPGFVDTRRAAGKVAGDDHRVAPTDRKEVPQESLAARIRKAARGS